MKKILSLLLIAASVFTLASCTKYKPVKSTKEEKRVIMTMSFGGEEYELRYELYRALFLNHKSEVDGGDPSVWSGADKEKYINEINSMIKADAAKIFAAFYISDVGVGFDVYSGKADKLVEEYIEESIDGVPGFDSYEAYLEHLKKINMNYSVQDLMYRYYIALDKIAEFYGGAPDDPTTKDDETVNPEFDAPADKVREFYYSESFKRVLYAYFSESSEKDPEDVRAMMESAKADGADAVRQIIGGHTATPGNDIETGIFISKNTFNNPLNEEISDLAFSLSDGDVSEVLHITKTGESALDGKYILFAAEKSEEDFERFYYQIKDAYISDLIASFINSHVAELKASAQFTDEYKSITHSSIKM